MTNLFISYNEEEDFRILICAFDKTEANELADKYRTDSHLDGKFKIMDIEDDISQIHFDCDYVIS